MADERGFPFISFLNPYVVVSSPKIYLHEVLRTFELVNELRDERERVVVPHGVLVQVPVILNHPLSSVLLRHKEYRGCLFGLGRADIAFRELLIDKL